MGNSLSQDSQAILEAAVAGDAHLLKQQIAYEPKLLDSVTLVKRRGVLHLAAKEGHPQVISTVLDPLLVAVREEYHVSMTRCFIVGLVPAYSVVLPLLVAKAYSCKACSCVGTQLQALQLCAVCLPMIHPMQMRVCNDPPSAHVLLPMNHPMLRLFNAVEASLTASSNLSIG
jgi:hypothetical protein